MYVAVWAGALVLSYRLFGGPLELWKQVAAERPDLLSLPDLAVPDQIFPELLVRYAPAWLTGLILAGATAAAMSTLDSILHANMTVLTRDLYQRYIAPDREAAHYVWVGRAIVLGLLIIGYVLSVRTFGFLVTLVTLSGAGAQQLLPGTLGVCYPTRRPFTKGPSHETISRIHGAIEDYVYWSGDEGVEEALRANSRPVGSTPRAADSV